MHAVVTGCDARQLHGNIHAALAVIIKSNKANGLANALAADLVHRNFNTFCQNRLHTQPKHAARNASGQENPFHNDSLQVTVCKIAYLKTY